MRCLDATKDFLVGNVGKDYVCPRSPLPEVLMLTGPSVEGRQRPKQIEATWQCAEVGARALTRLCVESQQPTTNDTPDPDVHARVPSHRASRMRNG